MIVTVCLNMVGPNVIENLDPMLGNAAVDTAILVAGSVLFALSFL